MQYNIKILDNQKDNDKLFSFLDLMIHSDFRKNMFEIPIFQRKYVWKSEKIEELLNEIDQDFKNFMEKKINDFPLELLNEEFYLGKESDYDSIFFGSIYISTAKNENKNHVIIDGQQRIFTWFLFLIACFRNFNLSRKELKKISNNNEFRQMYWKLYDNLKKWIFANSEDKNFDIMNINKNYKNFRLINKQEDDKEVLNELFDILFSCDEKLSEKIKDDLIKFKNKVGIIKKRELYNSLIFQSYLKIEDFLIESIDYIKNEKIILKHPIFLKRDFIEDYSQNLHSKFVVMSLFIYYFFPKFRFAIFNLNKIDKAPEIFETINGKGVQLKNLDIIKNSLYKFLTNNGQKNIDKFRDNFKKIELKIKESYGDLYKSDKFLLDFFKCCYSDIFKENILSISNSKLIDNFKQIFGLELKLKNKTYEQFSEDFLNNCIKFLDKYSYFFNKERNIIINSKLDLLINSLNILNFQTIKSILVSMFLFNEKHKLNFEDKIIDYVDKLYKYYLLKLTIDDEQANLFENNFKKIMYVILEYGLESFFENFYSENSHNQDQYVKSIFEFNQKMNEYFTLEKRDEKLQKIVEYEYKNNSIIKWYLYNIFKNNLDDDDSTVQNIQVEHVIPIKSDQWLNRDIYWGHPHNKNDIEQYKYFLGNCLLVHKKINIKMSNNIFQEKYKEIININNKKSNWLQKDKSIFGECSFIYVGENINYKRWDKELISERHEIIKNEIISNNIFDFN